MRTHPSVFIIESVRFADEDSGRREGRILSDILRMSGKEVRYRYIRTKKELRAVLKQFQKSQMRYLHFSCHGDQSNLSMTLDDIPFDEFAQILNPYLLKKRVFISACSATNRHLAAQIFPDSGCNSLCGPMGKILFEDAALMWASFYHIMFKMNPDAMKGADIRSVLTKICDMYNIAVKYFRASDEAPFYIERTIRPKKAPKLYVRR